jgi:hypothetical protein
MEGASMTVETQTRERLLAILEAAFFPLETHASRENGNVQIRVMDGAEAIHIDERPVKNLQGRENLKQWIVQTRKRLEELGRRLDSWEMPGWAG